LGMEAVAAIIIAVLIGSVMGVAVYKKASQVNDAKEIEACRNSIINAAQSKKFSLAAGEKTGTPLFPIDCQRRTTVIKKKDVVGKDGRINQDKAHKIIADEMKKCWYMAGEGKVDPFSNWDNKDETYCMVCTTIEYDNDLRRFINNKMDSYTGKTFSQAERIELNSKYQITSPLEYLKKPLASGSELSYWEYLYGEKSVEYSEEELNAINDMIVLPSSQIIIQMYKSDGKIPAWKGFLYGLGTASVLAGVWVGAVLLAPATLGSSLALGVKISILLGTTVFMMSNPITHSYKECPECNGIGGVTIVPQGQDLNIETEFEIDGKTVRKPYCSVLVN